MELVPILVISAALAGYFVWTKIILPSHVVSKDVSFPQYAIATHNQEISPVRGVLRTLVEKYVSRSYSDDYKSCERGVETGEDYSVTVGDVRFYFRYANYDLEYVSVTCVGAHVLTYDCWRAPTLDKVTWEHHSPQLEQHVLEATQVLLDRISDFDRSRQEWLDAIAKRDAEATAKAVGTLRERFGVDHSVVPRVKKQS